MNFTQEQITEILQEVANEKDGFNKIMKLSLDVLMKSERKVYQEETGDIKKNTVIVSTPTSIIENGTTSCGYFTVGTPNKVTLSDKSLK